MANRLAESEVHLVVHTETLQEIEPDAPLRMLVLGDFSGQSTGKLIRIDRDNFEDTLRKFSPRVELAASEGQVGDAELKFASLDDFEPDTIYRRNDIFAVLRNQKSPPLYSEPDDAEPRIALKPTAEQIARLASPGGLLDAIVEQSAGGAAAPAPARTDEFQSMVQRIVAPYATPAESPENRRASDERAKRVSLLMSHVLHDEQFQALEAVWRGLDLLVRGLDTDTLVHLYILDIAKEKLGSLQLSERWGLMIGNFAFDRAALGDVHLLEKIGALARSVGAPFLAEWLPAQEEEEKAQVAWRALRQSAIAPYIGLALPRFLLRLPYGRDTAPVEGFDFEEMPGDPVHTHYLWGNPAFACALAIGQLGAELRLPVNLRLGGMLLHGARPCTEVLLSEKDCEMLLKDGVLPLAAVKGSDSIVFPHMRSIADPPALIALG